jgi:hypothetical protein
LTTYSSPGFGGINALCNDIADAENFRRAFANGSCSTELTVLPQLAPELLKDRGCRLEEGKETTLACLCTNVE